MNSVILMHRESLSDSCDVLDDLVGMKRNIDSAARELAAPVVASLLLAMMFCVSYADEIYKVVDEDGNVSYSTEPPESSQAMEVMQAMPDPSEADVEAARRRQEKIEQDFDKLDEARAEQERLEAQQRANTTTTVVQTNTILGAAPWYHHPYGYWRGARLAPGAPTAPGYRPPHHRPPGHRPRPPIAVPYGARPGDRTTGP